MFRTVGILWTRRYSTPAELLGNEQVMASQVHLVGSRVSMMHVAHDCPQCRKAVTVTITDGGHDSTGHRRLLQQPHDCPDCGAGIGISLVAEPSLSDRSAQ
jgi:predicted RNA-binding Zn-ribbon protein involved in translation (DUF1610 family)